MVPIVRHETGQIIRPETSVTNYQQTLRNIPEQRRPQLHGGGSLKYRNTLVRTDVDSLKTLL
jgi:hypothetical protein